LVKITSYETLHYEVFSSLSLLTHS